MFIHQGNNKIDFLGLDEPGNGFGPDGTGMADTSDTSADTSNVNLGDPDQFDGIFGEIDFDVDVPDDALSIADKEFIEANKELSLMSAAIAGLSIAEGLQTIGLAAVATYAGSRLHPAVGVYVGVILSPAFYVGKTKIEHGLHELEKQLEYGWHELQETWHELTEGRSTKCNP